VSNLLVNDGRVVNAGAMTLNPTNDLGLRIYNSAVVSNSGSISVAPGKIQLYTNGRLDNTGLITNSTGIVLSEGGAAGLTIVNNLPGGAIQMNGGVMYVGLYYAGTFNNDGGDAAVAGAATTLVGGPSWATVTGSNTVGILNVNGGLFNHSGSGIFQVGPSLNAPNGTGIVNVAGGVLAVNKAIAKGNGPDSYGFFNFNGGTLSGTVNNVTLLGTDLSRVEIQAGGGRVGLAAGITNTIGASLQNGGGGGGLTKDGAGVLRLTGASLYTGTTRVMGGVLDLVGSASLDNSTTLQIDTGATLMASNLAATLHLKTGQTLKGNGTFVGGLITDSGSTMAPGASAGVLTVAGNLTLSGGSTLSMELDGTTAGTQYDQLVLSGGSLTLGSPALDILLGFTPAYNATFTIVSGLSGFDPGVNGIFSGKADGSSFTVGATEFQIDYNPSDITLTVIPEPVTTGLAGFVVLAGLLLRRRIR
jgi:autotransporter-associated beta strand protein